MEISVSVIWLVPVVLGLVQAAKMVGMDSRWSPILAVVLGVLGAVFTAGPLSGELVVQGVIVGLSAVGLWENGKQLLTK